MATTANTQGRPLAPIDLSNNALYTANRWHTPFAELRKNAPLTFRQDSPGPCRQWQGAGVVTMPKG